MNKQESELDVTPKEYLARAGLSPRSLDDALSSGKRIVAHIRDPKAGDIACTASLPEEIRMLRTEGGTPPLFVSYYTSDTPYEALAAQLRASLDRYGLPHRIEAIPSRGSWVANTGLKARFIERVWAETEGPICWLDADAAVLRPVGFLCENPFDFAIVRRGGWEDLSGFLYFGKSPAAEKLVQTWSQLCAANPHVWDQVLLSLAWFTVARHEPLASMWLNPGIFRFPRPKIRDLRDGLLYYPFDRKIRPFIDQKQASRELKAFVNASAKIRDELGSDDLSDTFKRAVAQYDFSSETGVETIFSRPLHAAGL
ncbi:hypothetical protein [Defluviimonas sp. WL0075]|uniref:Uncharacterized protein n=1 Tax=Albidovulum sediminicola TaxID=2984331 RepID=A0ABT2YYB0_9RHOB|nr:hypothetical protein [Defluviimonas sp. WL0075]MCV2863859.1 hypothetical protein [Defluviimonas sp. WL0075]